MNKYITESLKYFLRSNLFISKYYGEIKSLYEMSPIDLRDRNEKLFLKLFPHSCRLTDAGSRWFAAARGYNFPDGAPAIINKEADASHASASLFFIWKKELCSAFEHAYKNQPTAFDKASFTASL